MPQKLEGLVYVGRAGVVRVKPVTAYDECINSFQLLVYKVKSRVGIALQPHVVRPCPALDVGIGHEHELVGIFHDCPCSTAGLAESGQKNCSSTDTGLLCLYSIFMFFSSGFTGCKLL